MAGLKNAERAPVGSAHRFATEVLVAPDMPEKPLMDMKGARAHELNSESEKRSIRQQPRCWRYEKN